MEDLAWLPAGASLGILAFLLSLVPAGIFVWLWYLRRHDRSVPMSLVITGFVAGLVLVVPAFYAESVAQQAWQTYFPATAHYFSGSFLPLQRWSDVLWPAAATFLIVALVEEGLRFGVLWVWFRHSRSVDQVFDGLLVGVVTGLGFATLENTVYFWNLFTEGSFNTLVVVFFLRFLISTLAHTSFGGIMGALLAQGFFSIYRPGRLKWLAFAVPWLMHGLYDLFLSLNLTVYAVLFLVAPLAVIINWAARPDFFVLNRVGGKRVIAQQAPQSRRSVLLQQLWQSHETPWNALAPWLRQRRQRQAFLSQLEKHEV